MTEVIDEPDFIKTKSFWYAKDNVKRMRRQTTDWGEIFAKDASSKDLFSKIHKELLKLNNKKTILLKKTKTLTDTSTKKILSW